MTLIDALKQTLQAAKEEDNLPMQGVLHSVIGSYHMKTERELLNHVAKHSEEMIKIINNHNINTQ